MDNVFGERNLSSSVIQSLQQKYIRINSTKPALDRVAYDRNICCIERLSDVKVILSVSKVTIHTIFNLKSNNMLLF